MTPKHSPSEYLKTQVLTASPEQLQPTLGSFVPQLDQAFNNAMSLAIAQTFWIGVVAAALGLVAALFMRELPLRSTNAAPAQAGASSGGQDRPRPPVPAAD